MALVDPDTRHHEFREMGRQAMMNNVKENA